MKGSSLLLGLFAISAATAFSAPETSILLMGHSSQVGINHNVVTGAASAIVKSPADQTRITADEIIYDSKTRVLTCTGNVTIRSADRITTAREFTIELGAAVKGGNVYVLNSHGIIVDAVPKKVPEKQSTFEAWSAKHLPAPLPTFDSRPLLLPRQR